jgi:hypothetical protein
MALVQATLKASLKALMDTNPSTGAAAATAWGAAYSAYAILGQANGIPGIFTGLEGTQFANALLPVFSTDNSTAAQAATAFQNAMTAFWLTPPVLFGPTGTTTAITGLPALTALFTSLFSDKDLASNYLATILDTCTKTVAVTIVIPPPTVFTLL